MKHYTQLTQEQRYPISATMKAGFNQTETAGFIGVHQATVSRELWRNRGCRGHRPQPAQQLAVGRQQGQVNPRLPAPGPG